LKIVAEIKAKSLFIYLHLSEKCLILCFKFVLTLTLLTKMFIK